MPFQIIRNDITKVKADAIVNTANPEVRIGPGVDLAIYEAAGKDFLLIERSKIGKIEVGDVAVTPAGNLSAKYIFHESGPVWIDGFHSEIETLRKCYDKCLRLAIEYNCESIAFPLIASGAYGFPKDVSLRIAIDAFRTFLSENELEIFLVVYDSKAVKLSESMFDAVKSFVDGRFICTYDNRHVTASLNAEIIGDEPDKIGLALDKTGSAPDKKGKKFKLFDLTKKDKSKNRLSSSESCAPGMPPSEAYSAPSMPPYGASSGTYSAPMATLAAPEPASSSKMFVGKAPTKPLDDYIDRFEHQDVLTFGEYLQQMINKKGMTNKDVYTDSNLTKQYFSKLINNKVGNPAKEKILCLAVGLKLNIDETRDFLLHAGYAISPYSKIDLVFEYYIRSEKFDVYEISFALEDLGIEGGLWPELA